MTKLQYPDHNQKMLMDPHDNLWGTSNYVQNMVTSSNGIIFRVNGPFQWGIHRSPVTEASDVELWCFLWSTPQHAGGLRLHRTHYDVTVMEIPFRYDIKLYLNVRMQLLIILSPGTLSLLYINCNPW